MKPAPDHLLEFVNCSCKSVCDLNRCACKRANLQCTELCKYRTDCKNATIDSEDEICSNYNEDDLSDDDTMMMMMNIKAYFTSNFCIFNYDILRTERPNPHDVGIGFNY